MSNNKKKQEGPSNLTLGMGLMVACNVLQSHLGFYSRLGMATGMVMMFSPMFEMFYHNRKLEKDKAESKKEDFQSRFDMVLEKAGIKNANNELANVTEIIEKEKYLDIYVKLPIGVSMKQLEDKVDAIQTYYQKKVSIIPSSKKDENLKDGLHTKITGHGVVKMRMYTSTLPENVSFKIVPLSEKIDLDNPKERYGSLWFSFGRGLDGPMWCDLVKDNAFIAGEIGSGKSVLTHVILLQLLMNYSPEELQIEINDFKDGVEFEEYKRIPHVSHYSCDYTQLLDYLYGIEEEMRARIRQIKSVKGCRNLADYNCAVPADKRIPRKVILLEEMVVILGLEKKEAGEVRRKLSVICSQARAAGIHVICTTQRPSKEVIDPLIKTNINVRFGLLTVDEANSKIIIDKAGCNLLRGNGHGIYKFGSHYEEFQTMYATPKIQDKTVEEIIKKYPKTITEEKPNQMKTLLSTLSQEINEVDDLYSRCL